ncbi:Rv2578c family radical SAM protein [Nonomuraea sp. NPDC049152]|uniref:Rv2578c family radical SAM protein n=1 Tax=Nonomuraea sp. NPDC049152 TaxID=3154350 RepID=UPI0033E6ACC8
MRWDNLRLTDAGDDDSAVPLFARGAVARTFDTPEFKGMTFYEIQAKSIINKVPAASRVPFSYTINPYRGCSHSCTYCLVGDTPVLMADGDTKPIADLRPGDLIIGTAETGGVRRYVVTEVLAHWPTVKPAYRITLADGTTLVASGDHRFLAAARRGRRHVATDDRTHVATNDLGHVATDGSRHTATNDPTHDATDRSRRTATNDPTHDGTDGWRHVAANGARPVLTSEDTLVGMGRFAEPPKRDDDYRRGHLAAMGRDAGRPGGREEPTAGVGATNGQERAAGPWIAEGTAGSRVAEGAGIPSREWAKGFLAGAFDRHGPGLGFSGGDSGLITRCLDELGLMLGGGPGERLRFLHTVGPTSAWEPGLEGAGVTTTADLRVVSIEPLGVDLPMYDITTGTGDFIADGVVSHNCFARKTHEYLDLDAGHDFDSKIVVKVNAAELARKELAAPRWGGEHVAMGTNVDCYQRAEGRYRLMPGILSALTEAANPFSILTKGTLILRDLPLLVEAARVTEVSGAVSVGFLDEGLWRAVEPGTPNPRRRLEVCRRLNDSGIACGVLMAPILPYLSDAPEQLEETVGQIAAAGATHVSPIVLHLRPGAREWFLGWLSREHPRLVPRYLELYGRGAYAPKAYQDRVSAHVRQLAEHFGIGRSPGWRIKPDKAPEPEQLSLL